MEPVNEEEDPEIDEHINELVLFFRKNNLLQRSFKKLNLIRNLFL